MKDLHELIRAFGKIVLELHFVYTEEEAAAAAEGEEEEFRVSWEERRNIVVKWHDQWHKPNEDSY